MRIADAVSLIHHWYPPHSAESWDRVGLAVGDPDAPLRRVLLAVDPTVAVADEAVATSTDLLITHHPLLLRGVSSVAASTPKGQVVHELIRGECALLCAHTNADIAVDGVSEALAHRLGLLDVRPLVAQPDPRSTEPLDKLTTFAPTEAANPVREALAAAGAGSIGSYDSCSFSSVGRGRFRALPGANPHLGEVGELAVVEEERIEAVLPRRARSAVIEALLAAHPYETPAYDLVEIVEPESKEVGSGRIGQLPEELTLEEFARVVSAALPATAQGVRVAGDPHRSVRTVALVGGAGDGYLEVARRSGADVYLTSDLRHHPASEFLEAEGPALIDVAHWAAEWTWLPRLATRLTEEWGDTVAVQVSTICTDPWKFRV